MFVLHYYVLSVSFFFFFFLDVIDQVFLITHLVNIRGDYVLFFADFDYLCTVFLVLVELELNGSTHFFPQQHKKTQLLLQLLLLSIC